MVSAVGPLEVAAFCEGTFALGPGRRAVAWVQGCPLSCPECLAPEWIPQQPAMRLEPVELVEILTRDESVGGLTFSGGEPMAQASGLAEVARQARLRRPLSLICFTGFRLERLRRNPPGPGVDALLAETDVLIDGPYQRALDDGRGLRGSTNQRIHHLTDRLRDSADELEHGIRRAEIRFRGGEALLVGIPPPGLAAALDHAVTLSAGGGGTPVDHRSRSGAGS